MFSTIILNKNREGRDEIIIKNNSEIEVIKRALNGDFSSQRNYALNKAKGEWILFLDSDESLSEEIKEIPEGFDAFYLKRIDYFFGRYLGHGETGNIKLIRLGKKDFGKWVGKVHEVWVGNDKVGDLKVFIKHSPHETIRSFITKINFYTTIYANEHPKFNYFYLLKPPGKFIQNYFLKLGFLDGFPGFVMAFMMSLHSLIARVKQYEKQIS